MIPKPTPSAGDDGKYNWDQFEEDERAYDAAADEKCDRDREEENE